MQSKWNLHNLWNRQNIRIAVYGSPTLRHTIYYLLLRCGCDGTWNIRVLLSDQSSNIRSKRCCLGDSDNFQIRSSDRTPNRLHIHPIRMIHDSISTPQSITEYPFEFISILMIKWSVSVLHIVFPFPFIPFM